jgi:hypothetical protein
MTAAEFKKASPLADPDRADSVEESEAKRFLRIRWNYDPYSPTAVEDYDELVEEVGKFDVLSMLVRSIRYLAEPVRERAILSLVENLKSLYPVFPTVAIVLKALLPEVSLGVQQHVFSTLRGLVRDGSHITMVPTNAVYVARLLAFDKDEETDELLNQMYRSPNADDMLRRDCIYAMNRRGAHYWLSDLLKRHAQLGVWELRALLAASYGLGDEGKYWRKNRERELSVVDAAFVRWLGKMNNGGVWEVPL